MEVRREVANLMVEVRLFDGRRWDCLLSRWDLEKLKLTRAGHHQTFTVPGVDGEDVTFVGREISAILVGV